MLIARWTGDMWQNDDSTNWAHASTTLPEKTRERKNIDSEVRNKFSLEFDWLNFLTWFTLCYTVFFHEVEESWICLC